MSESKAILQVAHLGFPWKTHDPFLFCAHHRDEYPAGNGRLGVETDGLKGRNMGSDFTIKDGWRMYHGQHIPGFPYHPHRGFETITINKEGFVDHSDSLGASGRFGAGDVQWMTAGKGVQHSEMFPLVYDDRPNPLEIMQVWLNLPKRSKMVDPHFKMLWAEDIPVHTVTDDAGRETVVDVIAGEFLGTTALPSTPDSYAADPAHGVTVLTIKMAAGARLQLPAAAVADVSRTLYYYRGQEVEMNGRRVPTDHSIRLDPSSEVTIVNTESESYFLLLQGRPIGEPVAQHGPFVMNTPQEIQEAFEDYRRTQFGGWPWPEREQAHGDEPRRFAQHADGRVEEPS